MSLSDIVGKENLDEATSDAGIFDELLLEFVPITIERLRRSKKRMESEKKYHEYVIQTYGSSEVESCEDDECKCIPHPFIVQTQTAIDFLSNEMLRLEELLNDMKARYPQLVKADTTL